MAFGNNCSTSAHTLSFLARMNRVWLVGFDEEVVEVHLLFAVFLSNYSSDVGGITGVIGGEVVAELD